MNIFHLVRSDLVRRRGESILIILGITLGVAATFILLAFRSGVRESLFESAEKKNPLNEITVSTKSGTSLFNKPGMSDETIKEIAEMNNVESVVPHAVYKNFASVEFDLFGQKIITDGLIFGMENSSLDSALINIEWQADSSPLPVIISKKLLDLYNLSIAPAMQLPNISEKIFVGQPITIYPGFSSFFSGGKEPSGGLSGEIVGFSDRADLIGVTIPLAAVQSLNQKVSDSSPTYNKLFVTLKSARDVDSVSALLTKKGFLITSLQQQYDQLSRNLKYGEIAVFVLSTLIVVLTLTLIASSFGALLIRRRREIGIMKAIGASSKQLIKLFLLYSVVLSSIGTATGILLGVIGIKIFQQLLTKTISLASISIDTFFTTTPLTALLIFPSSIVLCAAICLIPIQKVAYQDPQKLISQ